MSSVTLKSIPKISKLASNIIRILGCNPGPMTLQGTNTYLIGNGERRLLLDTGSPNVPEYIHNLKEVIKENNVHLSDIIITHWHNDHIGGVSDILKSIPSVSSCSIWKYPRTDAEDNIPKDYNIKWLHNGQEFKLDKKTTLKIVHTPGHTNDHVIGLLVEECAVFSGDCILGEGTAVFENLYDYMSSLQFILDVQPKIIYPGHGSVVENPIPKIEYYINHRNEREKQILECLITNSVKSFTPMDIVKEIYQTTPRSLWNAAAVNVVHHLEKLIKEKKVQLDEESQGYKAKI